VVFEEGDLGITIKVTAFVLGTRHIIAPLSNRDSQFTLADPSPLPTSFPHSTNNPPQRTPTGQARVLRALPGTQAERNGVRPGDVLRAVADYDLRAVVLDSRSWADLIHRMKTSPRPLRVTVLRGGPVPDEEPASELHALERRLDFGALASRPPGLLPLDNDRRRALLYRGRLSLLQEGRLYGHSLQPRDAFLLSDALLLVVPPPEGVRQRAVVETAVGLATSKLRGHSSAALLPSGAFGFELVTPAGSYVLYAPSAEARAAWVDRAYRGIVALLQLAPHTQRQDADGGMDVDVEAEELIRHQLVIDTLHSAVLRGQMDEARELVASGGGDDSSSGGGGLAAQQDAAGRTPLHYACLMRRHDMASFLLSQTAADPSIVDQRGRLPLHLAALLLDDVAIALLLSSPQPLANARDAEGATPAFLAAVHGRLSGSNSNSSSNSNNSGGGGGGGSSDREADEECALRRCLNALLAHDADINARDHTVRALVSHPI
jgi:hypothetical protein